MFWVLTQGMFYLENMGTTSWNLFLHMTPAMCMNIQRYRKPREICAPLLPKQRHSMCAVYDQLQKWNIAKYNGRNLCKQWTHFPNLIMFHRLKRCGSFDLNCSWDWMSMQYSSNIWYLLMHLYFSVYTFYSIDFSYDFIVCFEPGSYYLYNVG